MTTLIQQRNPSDCMVCCIAMALNLPYETVHDLVHGIYDPTKGIAQEAAVLQRLGLKNTWENGEPTGDFIVKNRDWCIHPQYIRSWVWGRRAILTVPSLNIEDGYHAVYYDGRDVFDPSTMKRYDKFSELFPDEAVIFREDGALALKVRTDQS